MTALTRGPLPARVYWTRRVLLLVVVTALVVGLVQLVALAVGGGTTNPPDRAAPVAAEPSEPSSDPSAEPSSDATAPEVPAQAEPDRRTGSDARGTKDREPVPAEPEGPCVDRDVAVTPTAGPTVGGSPVVFTLELRTVQSPACTWEVSPQSLSVKVTSGDDAIWYSSQCPRSIPRRDVVLRNDETTEVEVTWSAKRSDEECSGDTAWALPGWYHVEAAALAGEPSDLQFELTAPEGEVRIEKVPPPKEPKRGDRNGRDRQRDGQRAQRG